jgi:hypothetical protein
MIINAEIGKNIIENNRNMYVRKYLQVSLGIPQITVIKRE